MTELREKVRAILSGHATDCALPVSNVEMRRESRNDATDAIMALIDRPAPVVVKELEWSQNAPQDPRSQWAPVEDIDRFYGVEPTSCGAFEAETKCFPRGSYDTVCHLGDFKSIEAAKAACQADFARRILSAVNAVSEARVAELEEALWAAVNTLWMVYERGGLRDDEEPGLVRARTALNRMKEQSND